MKEILEREISRRDFVKLIGAAVFSSFLFRSGRVRAEEKPQKRIKREEIDFLNFETLEKTQEIPKLTQIARKKSAPLMRSSSTIC